MRLRLVIVATVCFILVILPANLTFGVLVDFEGLGLAEGSFLTTIPGVPDVSFNNAIYVLPGTPLFGFNGNSSGFGAGGIDDANSGATISAPDALGSTVSVTFDTPIKDLMFDVVDIEIGSQIESFTARVYDDTVGGNLLNTITITGGDPNTGDGLLTPVDFSTGFIGTDQIQRLEFEQTTLFQGALTAGYAVDNLAFTPTPEVLTLNIEAVPNPAVVGNPLDILLDLENLGDGFDAEFRLWVLASGNVTTLVSLSPFVDSDLMIDDFNLFSTSSVPAGLPPVVGFLAAIFNAGNGELLTWDFESLGIGVAPSASDTATLRQTATDFLNSGDVNAAPERPELELSLNGKVNNPFESQVSAKGKLTTTWGRLKLGQ